MNGRDAAALNVIKVRLWCIHGTVSTGPLSAELQACKYISGSMVNESLQSYRGLMSPLGDLTSIAALSSHAYDLHESQVELLVQIL